MRAILLTAFGSAEHFGLAELPRPEPQPGEVRIRIHAAAFNPTDYQRRQGAGEVLPMVWTRVNSNDVKEARGILCVSSSIVGV